MNPPLSSRAARCFVLAVLFVSSPLAKAQGLLPFVPLDQTGDSYVADSTLDKLYRFQDLNLDGDANDVGEVVVFYDDTIGTIDLGNNSGLALGPTGDLFVCDRGEGAIFRFQDLDGDGTANGPGEHSVYFDGDPMVNAGGLTVVAPVKMALQSSGVMWIAEADQGGLGADSILRMQDLNGDGDANDLGEVVRFFEPAMGTMSGDVQIVDVFISVDGFLHYVEGSSTGFRGPGIYRLDDADSSGLIDPATEDAPFFLVPASPLGVFLQAGGADGAGNMYVTDTGNDVIWRARDDDASGTVDPLLEAQIFFTAPTAAIVWDVDPTEDGRVLCSAVDPDGQVFELKDGDASGAADNPSEFILRYTAPMAAVSLTNPRGVIWMPQPVLNVTSTVPIGTSGVGSLTTTPNDLAWVFLATTLTPPVPIVPFGMLELDRTGFFTQYASGVVPASGLMFFSIPIPNDPGLVGVNAYWQALCGTVSRFQLSTLASLTIM